jgi:hypothetical protein
MPGRDGGPVCVVWLSDDVVVDPGPIISDMPYFSSATVLRTTLTGTPTTAPATTPKKCLENLESPEGDFVDTGGEEVTVDEPLAVD